MFKEGMRVHLVGVGGIGMSGLAQLLKEIGCQVSGSDRDSDKPENLALFDKLRLWGVTVYPQDGSYVAGGMPEVIVWSSAVEEGNPDFVAAPDAVRMHRAAALQAAIQEYAANGVTIAVAGSSGKTSVTAYTAELLDIVAGGCGCLNGGMVKRFITAERPGNFHPGSRYWVFEADESDKSLLGLSADYAIILNIGRDHYDEEELARIFGTFTHNIRRGIVVGEGVHKLISEYIPAHLEVVVVADGVNAALPESTDIAVTDYRISNGMAEATVSRGERFNLPQPGVYTALNVVFAAALIEMIGFDFSKALRASSELKGVARRFDRIGDIRGATPVYDDYAHNPQKLEMALKTAQSLVSGRAFMIWQPHGYGPLGFMRDELGTMLERSLRQKDVFVLMEPFYAGGTSLFSPHASEVVDAWHREGRLLNVTTCKDRDALKDFILGAVAAEDIVLVSGARDNSLPEWARGLTV